MSEKLRGTSSLSEWLDRHGTVTEDDTISARLSREAFGRLPDDEDDWEPEPEPYFDEKESPLAQWERELLGLPPVMKCKYKVVRLKITDGGPETGFLPEGWRVLQVDWETMDGVGVRVMLEYDPELDVNRVG